MADNKRTSEAGDLLGYDPDTGAPMIQAKAFCPRCGADTKTMDEHLAQDDDWEWTCKAQPGSAAWGCP